MRALTFNIWNIVFAKHVPQRMAAIKQALTEAANSDAGWDVVLLQELWSRKARRLFGDCGYPFIAEAENYWATPLQWLGALFGLQVDSGLKILSKFPVVAVRRLVYANRGRWLRVAVDGEVLARKSALAAKVQHPTWGDIWVINTHLIAAYPDEPYTVARKSQLMELHDFVRELMKDAPVIVGGDLNVGPKVNDATSANSYIPELWDDLMPRIFGDFSRAEELDQVPTCSHLTCSWNDGTGEECHLDHLFLGPGLKIDHAAVTLDEAMDLAPGLRGHLSDHYGFEVAISPSMPSQTTRK